MKRISRLSGVMGCLAALLLAACVAAPPAASDEAPEKVTILFWDQFPNVSDQMDTFVATFNESQDRIEVVRESFTSGTMRDVIRTALSSGTGPDIFYYDLGPGFAGVLANADLLMPLDEAYTEMGWDQRIYPWTLARSTFGGHTYGVANELEFIGIFYNTRLFAEHGWTIPASWDELIGMCSVIQEAGLIPLAFTNGSSWPSYHMFSIMMNNKVGRDRLTRMISGLESWDHPDTVDAIQKFFVDLPAADCFMQDFDAISYDDGLAMLQTGKAAMFPSGTWLVEALSNPDNTSEPIGFFFLPSIDGNPIVVPGGIGSGWVVSAATEHPEAVVEFLDYLISEEMGPHWVTEINAVPAYPVDTSALDLPDLLVLALDILGEQAESMGYNIDVVVPANFNQVQWDGFAAIFQGIKTPAEVAAELQAAMEEAKAAGEVINLTE